MDVMAPVAAGGTSSAVIESRTLTPRVGSVVDALDLKGPLDAATVGAIRALLIERGVLFFPRQHLTPEQHIAFTALFGEVNQKAGFNLEPKPGDLPSAIFKFDSRDELYGRVSRWHADSQASQTPRAIAVNQAITVPAVGGDTLWASGEAAYDRLSEPLKRLVDPLRAVFAFTPLEASEWGKGDIPYHWAEHPVVRVHPESGRKSLFVSPRWTWEIVGLRPHESRGLLELLYDHITQHEHIVRYRWTEGDIAMWDNRNTFHYAVDDYDGDLRIMHTVGTAGDQPFGPQD